MLLTTLENNEKIEGKDDNNDDEEMMKKEEIGSICLYTIYRNGKNMCTYGQ